MVFEVFFVSAAAGLPLQHADPSPLSVTKV